MLPGLWWEAVMERGTRVAFLIKRSGRPVRVNPARVIGRLEKQSPFRNVVITLHVASLFVRKPQWSRRRPSRTNLWSCFSALWLDKSKALWDPQHYTTAFKKPWTFFLLEFTAISSRTKAVHLLQSPVQQSISLSVFYTDRLKDTQSNSFEFPHNRQF